jgi:PadR family transcriptional regulator, regulatory protein PadR
MRLTHQTKQVLLVLLEAPGDEVFGYELTIAAGLPTGTVYPILKRLENEGWLEGRTETVGEREGGRGRPRRYYRLTGLGQREGRRAIADQREGLRALTPGWGMA